MRRDHQVTHAMNNIEGNQLFLNQKLQQWSSFYSLIETSKSLLIFIHGVIFSLLPITMTQIGKILIYSQTQSTLPMKIWEIMLAYLKETYLEVVFSQFITQRMAMLMTTCSTIFESLLSHQNSGPSLENLKTSSQANE